MNELLLLVEICLTFGTLLLFKKFFAKAGIYAWIALATVLANIQTVKSIDVFGVSSMAGTVLFASVFLATDILRECYGKEAAKKGVYIGVASVLAYLLSTQLMVMYVPAAFDISQGSMETLFALSPRVCFASLAMYAVSNLLDVIVYDKLYKMTNGKALWLRNNVSTILCNGLENFGFVFLAFAGVYPFEEVLMMAISTSVIEVCIALCDTPFVYLGKKI